MQRLSFRKRVPGAQQAPSPSAASSASASPTPLPPNASSQSAPTRSPIPLPPTTTASSSLPPSTRISPHNGSLQTSTGIPSLDIALGGGIPTSTLLLVQEDNVTSYASLLLRYFVAQGVVGRHAVCVIGAEDPEQLGKGLMAAVGVEEDVNDDDDDDDDENRKAGAGLAAGGARSLGALRRGADEEKMKIAWRYQSLPKLGSAGVTSQMVVAKGDGAYCHVFDVTKQMPASVMEAAADRILYLNPSEWIKQGHSEAQVYAKLLDQIKGLIKHGAFSLSSPLPPNPKTPSFLRIAIQSIASPYWGTGTGQPASAQALFRFLTSLRSLLSTSRAVCMLTLPAHLYADAHLVSSSPFIRRVQTACDGVIEIESFAGSSRLFPESFTEGYHGLLHIHRLPALHALTHASRLSTPDLHSLAFRLRRKRFLVEPFELPPESETGQGRSQDGSDEKKKSGTVGRGRMKEVTNEIGGLSLGANSGGGCATGVVKGSSKLDF
ncbi:Elongator subunit elp4 [Chytridiales sp. JEL 0842]|nr:Elongator subunit elp4 [Chytridiales sp. JEL 0842]